jgi:anthranilate 1,2-dioxygenase small subunit
MASLTDNPASQFAEIQALQSLYVELIDDDRLEDWPDLFLEKCTYKIVSRENHDRGLELATMFCDSRGMLIDRVVSLRQANIFPNQSYRHVLSAPRIVERSADHIAVQTNFVLFQTRNEGVTTIYCAGKYVDEVVPTDSGLRFRSRLVILDTNRIDTLMSRPV